MVVHTTIIEEIFNSIHKKVNERVWSCSSKQQQRSCKYNWGYNNHNMRGQRITKVYGWSEQGLKTKM